MDNLSALLATIQANLSQFSKAMSSSESEALEAISRELEKARAEEQEIEKMERYFEQNFGDGGQEGG